jgi:two-component system, NtrC family, response regulator HydG
VARVLICDDEAGLRDSLVRALARDGHEAEGCPGVAGALASLAGSAFDALVTDLRLGERSGLELIAEARRRFVPMRIMAITAFGSVDVAVEAMRLGADDFLEKPFRLETLRERLARLLEPAELRGRVARLERENECLREELQEGEAQEDLVGVSPALARLRGLIARVAPTNASVLVRGETGTGKELVAHRLHRLSARAQGPFVAFNCSAVSESLAESELFGHERGAFTGADRRRVGRFELADGGTLFLDEVGDLSGSVQAKLLRALQERAFERVGGSQTVRVDVRVVAATNRDLESALRDGAFRDDLYYRLNVVTLELPALRERPEDVPPLVELFLARYGRRADGQVLAIAPAALEALQAFDWPGNVRQLENVVHRAAILCVGDEVGPEDVALELSDGGMLPAGSADLRSVLMRVERDLLVRALREHDGNLSAAGRALGVERNLLRYKLRKHGLRS